MNRNETVIIPAGKDAAGAQLGLTAQIVRPGDSGGSMVPANKPVLAPSPEIQGSAGNQRMAGWTTTPDLEDVLVFVSDNSAGLTDLEQLLFDSLGYAKLYTYTSATYAVFQGSANKTTLFRQATSFYPLVYKGFRLQASQDAASLDRDMTILTYNLKGSPKTETRNLAQGVDGTLFNPQIVKYTFDAPQPVFPYEAIYYTVPDGETFTWSWYPYGKLNILSR